MLDVGALKGSLVEETERRVHEALRQVDAMAPCVVFCDELEKALGGAASGSSADSGVGSRLFGALLIWLNDHESDAFFVGTCNDVSRLPPEFARAGRFDGVFFLDLPGRAEKDAIWRTYLERYGLDPSARRPEDRDWTGAEVRACCRLAALLGVAPVEAAHHVVPVAATAGEAVERPRQWASGRCLSAERPGLYSREAGQSPRPGPAGPSAAATLRPTDTSCHRLARTREHVRTSPDLHPDQEPPA